MARREVFVSWIPALVGMGLIFFASSLPGDRIHLPDFRFSDKVVHFLVYALLGVLLRLRHPLRRRLGGETAPAFTGRDTIAMAVGILYGVSDEIHQLFVPLRQFAISDMTADALGIVFGLWVYGRLSRRRGNLERLQGG